MRVALRALLRRPAVAAATVLTLSLGIGATTSLFSVVDTVLLKPLPFPDADQLVLVLETSAAKQENASLVAPARIRDWERDSHRFAGISGSYSENFTDTSGAEPERLAGRDVLPRYFDVFGMKPLLGRTFTPDEERHGGPAAAIISESLWSRRYGRSPSVLSRRLILKGTTFPIIGVMPARFATADIDVWLAARLSPALESMRDARFVTGIARIKPGVSIAQAQSDLAAVQARLAMAFPKTDRGWSVALQSLKDAAVGDYRHALWVVFGAVVLLLLIGIANIAGLLLVQLRRRARELAVRSAIGASRAQIVLAVMREVLILTAAGTVGGILLAFGAIRLLPGALSSVPRIEDLTLDWRALAFAVLMSALAAAFFGLLPALQATRGKLLPLVAQSGRGVVSGSHRLQRALVVAQIALTVLLVASAGLLLRTYENLSHVPLGFDPSHTLTFHVGAQWDEDRARVGQMQVELIQRLEQAPGIVAAGLTNFLPATGATLRYQVQIDGLTPPGESGLNAGERTISAGYLQAMKFPLIAGQWCPHLRADFNAPGTAMINRQFADQYGGGQNLIGRTIRFTQDPSSRLRITGIVGNAIEDGAGAEPFPYVYACQSAGSWPDPEYVVRTAGDAAGVAPIVRQIVHEVAPGRALFGTRTVNSVLDAALDQPRLDTRLVALFAAAAMLLAALGLHTLLMLLVSERTQEIGIRMTLGATSARVVRLILTAAGRLLAIGITIGLLAVFATARILAAILYGVTPLDPSTLAATVLILAVASIAAAALPALRASRVDPVDAMRAGG